jgi:amino acid transporter
MWFSILFGLILIVVAAMMLIRNTVYWHSVRSAEMKEREHNFLYRQYRRRTQANSIIAIVGVAIIFGVWVTDSVMVAAYWLGVMLLVGWMALLAVVDLVSTRIHYSRLHREQLETRAILEAELKQLRKRGSNGRAKNKPFEDLE